MVGSFADVKAGLPAVFPGGGGDNNIIDRVFCQHLLENSDGIALGRRCPAIAVIDIFVDIYVVSY